MQEPPPFLNNNSSFHHTSPYHTSDHSNADHNSSGGSSSSSSSTTTTTTQQSSSNHRTTTAYRQPVVTVSSLYSTAQCILSMVGSIGVILLFAGIPQLIYSPSVQMSNLMTFLLGASLITAMVGGNAFVNYKYRQYLYARNQAVIQNRRLSRERREAADKPPSYDDLDKFDSLPPPDYNSVLEQKPPRYEEVASLYQWSTMIDSAASCSNTNYPNSSSCCPITIDSANTGPCSYTTMTSSDTNDSSVIKQASLGQVNPGFESCNNDPIEIITSRPPSSSSRKQSIGSISGDAKQIITAPVHKMINKFIRSKSYTIDPECVKNSQENECRFVNLKKLGKVFIRSSSEETFTSLPSKPNEKLGFANNFETNSVDEEKTDDLYPNEIVFKPSTSDEILAKEDNLPVPSSRPVSRQCSIDTSRIYNISSTNGDEISSKYQLKNTEVKVDVEIENIPQDSYQNPHSIASSCPKIPPGNVGSKQSSAVSQDSISQSVESRRNSEVILRDLKYIYLNNENDDL